MKFLKNALYLPSLFFAIYFFCRDFFVASAIVLKWYSANYFYWFNDTYRYKNIPTRFNWIKQFVRFTDTGHIVSLLYIFDDKKWFQIAFTVHFTISLGYWVGKMLFQMRDCDSIKDNEIIKPLEHCFCYLNHSLPFIILYGRIHYYQFQFCKLFYSFLWLYGWFFLIYLPWRLLTQDPVYDFLKDCWNQKSLVFIFLIHVMIALGNFIVFIQN
jgi:hypothetical protein